MCGHTGGQLNVDACGMSCHSPHIHTETKHVENNITSRGKSKNIQHTGADPGVFGRGGGGGGGGGLGM